MTIGEHLYTVEEFDRIAEKDSDKRLELIHGRIFEKMPTQEHGIIQVNTASELRAFVKPRNLGRVSVETRHRKFEDQLNSRLPDVSFISDTALDVVKKGAVLQMPDLAVEVKSPDDKEEDLLDKALYYLRNGSRLVWLMFPEEQFIKICTLAADDTLHIVSIGINDMLDGGDVLPGFSVPVKVIFEV